MSVKYFDLETHPVVNRSIYQLVFVQLHGGKQQLQSSVCGPVQKKTPALLFFTQLSLTLCCLVWYKLTLAAS